jgi:PGF-pre-PGF domain-containing protein
LGRTKDLIRIIGIVLTMFSVSIVVAYGSPAPLDNDAVLQLCDQADKYNITESQQKISADLLKLIDDTTASQSSLNSLSNTNDLQSPNFIPANTANGLDEDLVYVYVYLKKHSSIEVIKPFVQEITDLDEENSVAVVWISVNKLEELASLEEVRNIRTVLPPIINVGSVNTQGDDVHGTASVRASYGEDGSGIKIGVISDGVNYLAESRASGNLPEDVTVLSDGFGGNEGTAILEIIHDMAPGAKLYFHDNGGNTIAFNTAIDELIAAGCNIILDDVAWYNEPFFQDGIVASHVEDMINSNNIIYLSSAGNDADSHYQGTYVDDGDNFHNEFFTIHMEPESKIKVVLQWDDPFGSSSNDYDLLLYDENDIVAISNSTGPDPLEWIEFYNTGPEQDYYVGVYNYQGMAATRTLELFFYPSLGATIDQSNLVPEDSIYGHPAAPSVVAVGAVPWNNITTIEYYSSQGPVTIAYPEDSLRQKPDICGVDGVSTGAEGFTEFWGTSASVPHVAAVAAQIWSSNTSMTATEVRNRLLFNAVEDIDIPGFDYVYGYGIADASKYFINIMGDLIPPRPVTDLQETGIGPGWIRWTWTNPTDADLKHVMVYIDGSFVTNTTEEFYNSTGLAQGTAHTIGTKTVDTSGNIKDLWVNASATTPPANGVTMELAGHFGGEIFNVAVAGDYAYAAENATFEILDITDPASPTLIGSYETQDPIYDIEIADNYAYVANYGNGLIILNITDPTSPELIGNYDTTALTSAVAVTGNYVCLADHYNGLVILDATDPKSPIFTGSYDTAGFAEGLAVADDHAYLADGSNGLVIMDITDPASPQLTGNYDTPGNAEDGAVSGRYAYVADGDDGLIILDISDPASPKLTGSYDTAGYAYCVAISGNYAYIADRYNGLVILDITNPSLPTLAGSYNIADNWVTGVTIVDNYAYVADTFNGLSILRVTAASDTTPPAPVTNLQETGIGSSWIKWTWAKPMDIDLKHVMVYFDGVFVTNTSEDFYNATGLAEGTLHTISTKIVDISGNINYAWVNDSATTATLLTISELSGKDITSSSITLTWINSPDISIVKMYRDNGIIGNVSGSTSYVDSSLARDTTYNYTLIPYNNDGLEGKAVSISLKTKSSSGGGGGGGGSSNKKSSGGGGGGAGSAEDFANVAVKDVDTQYLRMNANVTYEFSRSGNDIQSVSFYSLKNSGETTSAIEVLKDKSKLANSTPEGTIYKYVNIWVGKAGFATAANIKDAQVKFKVNSSWIEQTGANPSDVRLQRYNGTGWEVLPTTMESSTTSYTIFESQTPGFSPFAITAEKVLASSTNGDTDVQPIQTEDADEGRTQPEKSNIWTSIMAILAIGVFVVGYEYLKRRSN